ncbi:gamma-glutamyl-gamma-aminobutyrate hydrolase family protein [Ligilactobacillus ruminis]|uniref:gamma-glutamyl-gamma-aminobutyrate hydrolase family protein n=1 Tax=Ligilactobacillus ruminis TaxID=1623 RepID=UPI0030815698
MWWRGACGVTLYQDLVKEGGFESHSGSRYPRNEGWHRVDFEPRSRFADIFGKSSVMVNSYHHQGVRLPGKGCEIKGKSEDGVPEAIEVMNHPFALAVQWHPEMMFDSEEQAKLLAAFVDAAKKF